MFRRGRRNETTDDKPTTTVVAQQQQQQQQHKGETASSSQHHHHGQKLWYKRTNSINKNNNNKGESTISGMRKDVLLSSTVTDIMEDYEHSSYSLLNTSKEQKEEGDSDLWDSSPIVSRREPYRQRHGPAVHVDVNVDEYDTTTAGRSFISGTFNLSLQSEMEAMNDKSNRFRIHPPSSKKDVGTLRDNGHGITTTTREPRPTTPSNSRSSMATQPSLPQRKGSPVRTSQRVVESNNAPPCAPAAVEGSDSVVPPPLGEHINRHGPLPDKEYVVSPARTGVANNNSRNHGVQDYQINNMTVAQSQNNPDKVEEGKFRNVDHQYSHHNHNERTVDHPSTTTVHASNRPGNEVHKQTVIDDYDARYAEKVIAYSGGNGNNTTVNRPNKEYITLEQNFDGVSHASSSGGQQHYHHHQHHHHHDDGQDEMEDTTNGPEAAQALADTMQSDIHTLEQTIDELRRDLRLKGDDIYTIEVESLEVSSRADDLRKQLQEEQVSLRSKSDEYERRRSRLAILHTRMEELQTEIAWEESNLVPLEQSVLISQEEALVVESRLYDTGGELDRMEAMKHALQEERDAIARNLAHTESELLSLKTIQVMALGGDCLGL